MRFFFYIVFFLDVSGCSFMPTDAELDAAAKRVVSAQTSEEKEKASKDLAELEANRDRVNSAISTGEGIINPYTAGVGGTILAGVLGMVGVAGNRKKKKLEGNLDTSDRIGNAMIAAVDGFLEKEKPDKSKLIKLLIQYQEQFGIRAETRTKRAELKSDVKS